MKKTSCNIALSLLAFSTATVAGSMGATSTETFNTGLFIGLGGSYNSVKYDQKLHTSGIANIIPDAPLDPSAVGSARGTAAPFHNTQSTFAPEVQAGYVQHFNNSEQLWGVKFSYQYLGLTSSNQYVNIPLSGGFTDSDGVAYPFSGSVNHNASQLNVEHEWALIPFIGHSFTNSFLYLGVGPSLFKTQTNYYGTTGTAIIFDAFPVGINMPDYSASKWMWGGAAEIGMAYYINPTWFVDINYHYAVTKKYSSQHTSSFNDSSFGFSTSGAFIFSTSQQVTAQAVKLSINKVFSL